MTVDQVDVVPWSTVGGHPALDLCNTRAWRLDPGRSVDRIATPARFLGWYADVVGGPSSTSDDQDRRRDPDRARPADEVDLDAVRDLRDATIVVLDAHLADAAAPAAAVLTVTAAWRAALAAVRPSARLPLTWTARPGTPRAELHTLALAVVDLLRDPDLQLLRRCDGTGCGWLFLDRTRNHSRRWCDAADCGNRARVRAYAERQRQRPAEGQPAGPSASSIAVATVST